MKNFILNLFFIISVIPILSCKKTINNTLETDNNSYINDFELLQSNSINDTLIKITSPKAIIEPLNNDIQILDSLIEINNKIGKDIQIKSGNSDLNNSKNIIRVYNEVYISLLNTNNAFIKTSSFEWNLNTSDINLNSSLDINFDNTNIISSNGTYFIDKSLLEINNNIFNRSIFNVSGQKQYQIEIYSDVARWFKKDNTLEFISNLNQVETTIKIFKY